MIFMLRDGRDIVDSLLDANSEGGWLDQDRPRKGRLRKTDEERLEWVRENVPHLGRADADVCEQAYERHDPALRQRIRYEDLLADPKRSLAQLTEWLGLPHDEARIGEIVARHSFDEVPEKRQCPGQEVARGLALGRCGRANLLTPAEREVVGEVMGMRLAELGYGQVSAIRIASDPTTGAHRTRLRGVRDDHVRRR